MKKAARRLGTLCLSLAVAGCATARDYPRCYLFQAPQAVDLERVEAEDRRLFEPWVGEGGFASGKDWVTVRAVPATHGRIARIWPGVGCVNLRNKPPLTGDMHDKWIVGLCEQYLEALLARLSGPEPRRGPDVADRFKDFTCH